MGDLVEEGEHPFGDSLLCDGWDNNDNWRYDLAAMLQAAKRTEVQIAGHA
jgi:hypothetical protein